MAIEWQWAFAAVVHFFTVDSLLFCEDQNVCPD